MFFFYYSKELHYDTSGFLAMKLLESRGKGYKLIETSLDLCENIVQE